jgi:hypothetical protein
MNVFRHSLAGRKSNDVSADCTFDYFDLILFRALPSGHPAGFPFDLCCVSRYRSEALACRILAFFQIFANSAASPYHDWDVTNGFQPSEVFVDGFWFLARIREYSEVKDVWAPQ